MKFAVKMLLFSAAAVEATRIRSFNAECPCTCISHEPLWEYYDYGKEIYVDPGCTECEVVVNETCFTIQKAEEDKVAAAKLAVSQKAEADAIAAHLKKDALDAVDAKVKAAMQQKAAAEAAEAAFKLKTEKEILAAEAAQAAAHAKANKEIADAETAGEAAIISAVEKDTAERAMADAALAHANAVASNEIEAAEHAAAEWKARVVAFAKAKQNEELEATAAQVKAGVAATTAKVQWAEAEAAWDESQCVEKHAHEVAVDAEKHAEECWDTTCQ